MIGITLSWVFGIISSVIWIFIFVLQFKKNYINKSNINLSFYFIFAFLIGDTLSNFSAYYKGTSVIILYISSCNIVCDIIFICQYLYYKFGYLFNIEISEYTTLLEISNTNINTHIKIYVKLLKDIITKIEIQLLIVYILFFTLINLILNITHIEKLVISEIYAWISFCIYLLARPPQIYLNYKRKSVVGLSLMVFYSIIFANFMFLTSILIRLIDLNENTKLEYINKNIQWIIGPILTSLLDVIIICQYYYYN